MPQLRYFLILVLIILNLKSFGQSLIKGVVEDVTGIPLPNTTVSVKNQDSNAILNFAITDSKGVFSISINSDSLNLIINASYLGYKSVNKQIENKSQDVVIVMQESFEELREVVIESHRIEVSGDTLSYSVAAFKDGKDRTIADVLKKMPGIEVMPNGQIFYMGAPIEKYYIEGMDMLEGRYNLANDNISAEDVSKVEVLENHQPIRVLDSLVPSDRTSLNIKLKNNISVSGVAEVAGGFSPILFKTNITPLFFAKKSQALVSYQYNNTGSDLARSINDFSSSNNFLSRFSPSKSNILSLNQLSRPPFTSIRWLNNNDHLGNVNYLYRIRDQTDLKINLSYLNGVHEDRGERRTIYVAGNDTITYTEKGENIRFLNSLNSKFTIEKNLSKSYFRNALAFQTFWDSQRNLMDNNDLTVRQELSDPYTVFNNELKAIKPLGNQLITINSINGYTKTDQQLMVRPGQFEELLNEGQYYQESKQKSKLATFFSENTVGFDKKMGAFTVSPKVGFAYRNEKLLTSLFKSEGEGFSILGNDYQNDLRFVQSNFFITTHLNYKKRRWKVVFKSPLYLRYFGTKDGILNTEETVKALNFEPDLFISRKLSPYWEVIARGAIENRYGTIDNLFEGFVLKNYLSLLKYNSTLKEENIYYSTIGIKYRHAIKALFVNMSFSLRKNKSNILYNNFISNNGALIVESLVKDNDFTNQGFNLNMSKYFSKVEMTLKAGGNLSFSSRPQIVNGVWETYKNNNQRYHVDLESKIANWFTLSGYSVFTNSTLRNTHNQASKINNWENSVAAYFYLKENQLFNIEAEYYYNQVGAGKIDAYFVNSTYQFTVEKYNLDAKITWNNILNTNSYKSVYNDAFFRSENNYVMRPSQLLIGVKFSL